MIRPDCSITCYVVLGIVCNGENTSVHIVIQANKQPAASLDYGLTDAVHCIDSHNAGFFNVWLSPPNLRKI